MWSYINHYTDKLIFTNEWAEKKVTGKNRWE